MIWAFESPFNKEEFIVFILDFGWHMQLSYYIEMFVIHTPIVSKRTEQIELILG